VSDAWRDIEAPEVRKALVERGIFTEDLQIPAPGSREFTGDDVRAWAENEPSYPAWFANALVGQLSKIVAAWVLGGGGE